MSKKTGIFFLIVCSLLFASCRSQVWTRYTPKTSPPASGQGAIAFMDASNTAVLFGGITIEKWLDETWIWDGKTWQQAFPKHSPPARAKPTMAYDAARDKVVLFGGSMDKTLFGDTWEWDGRDWQLMDPVHQPPARCCHGMAYDSLNKNVIIYGGHDPVENNFFNDAWAWDGKDWTEITCCGAPAMSGHTMIEFPLRDEIISVQTSGYGTWSWDGRVWMNLGIENPPHRSEGKLAYDRKHNWVVFFGGSTKEQPLNDTWIFDGQTWFLLSSTDGPSPRFGHVMFYDPNREAVILFGGIGENNTRFDDTWELKLPEALPTVVGTVTPSATPPPVK